ncbi:asparagine synthase (glutamine-hydrolyzing), partial [candidate division WWE3 bacterium]|nr:asparagine synthase (glutamine-hydrolyzing) [candidate division WWE3 bacterium]
MCGICGFSGNYTQSDLSVMADTLAHRGPDSKGDVLYSDMGIGLGHRRLAIIDLSPAGNQPMYDDSGDIVIVFNGEIYNFQTIRKRLAANYTFKSNSDTEVLINAYKEWGTDCLSKLNGMFSFVIYDKRKRLLFGARDKIGEKPLKYYYDGKNFVFASEVKAILKIIKHAPEIDPVAIHHYLTLQYVPSPMTGFKNIYKLPPAHYFIFQNGNLEIKKYWSLDFSNKDVHSEQEWEEIIIKEIERSVKMRMIADVPIGALLSGGLDSSTVVAFMAKNSPKPINTFSIGFDNQMFDESQYAKIVSDLYSTSHNTLMVTSNDLMELLPTLMDYYDEPIADNSILPTFLVSKLTREQVTVALDGDGGDENFAGYDRYNIV